APSGEQDRSAASRLSSRDQSDERERENPEGLGTVREHRRNRSQTAEADEYSEQARRRRKPACPPDPGARQKNAERQPEHDSERLLAAITKARRGPDRRGNREHQ